VAQREWRRVGKLLVGAGVMTGVDRAVLALYCQAYGRWVEAEEKLIGEDGVSGLTDLTPNGMVIQSVYLQIANKAMEQVKRYGAELGLTPAARTRIHVQSVEAKKSLAEMLFEGVADGRGG
jgi:P27 family predicted phage terminase small subunit